MLDELRDVLGRQKFKKKLAHLGKSAEDIVSDFLSFTQIVEIAKIITVIEGDPDDDVVLATAVGGKAESIVTGDPHLLTLAEYKSIKIWTVHQLLEYLA